MNPAVKATGAAAGIALALVDIVSWSVKLAWGIDVPSSIATDFTALITFGLGYLIHSNGPSA